MTDDRAQSGVQITPAEISARGMTSEPITDAGASEACIWLALDRMEPMRPVADRAVLESVTTTTFSGGDFSIQPDGVCRLNPELARRVVQLAHEQV